MTELAGALKKYDSGRRANESFSEQVEQKREPLQRYEDLSRELGHKFALVVQIVQRLLCRRPAPTDHPRLWIGDPGIELA